MSQTRVQPASMRVKSETVLRPRQEAYRSNAGSTMNATVQPKYWMNWWMGAPGVVSVAKRSSVAR